MDKDTTDCTLETPGEAWVRTGWVGGPQNCREWSPPCVAVGPHEVHVPPKSDVMAGEQQAPLVDVRLEAVVRVVRAHYWTPRINPGGGCNCGYAWHRIARPKSHEEHVAELVLAAIDAVAPEDAAG